MLPVLKIILTRLEKIEQQLSAKEKSSEKPVVQAVKIPQEESTISIVSVNQEAKAIIIEAKDEAFRIKKEAEDESRKVRQEALVIQQRLVTKEEAIDRKFGEFADQNRNIEQKEAEIEKSKVMKLRSKSATETRSSIKDTESPSTFNYLLIIT